MESRNFGLATSVESTARMAIGSLLNPTRTASSPTEYSGRYVPNSLHNAPTLDRNHHHHHHPHHNVTTSPNDARVPLNSSSSTLPTSAPYLDYNRSQNVQLQRLNTSVSVQNLRTEPSSATSESFHHLSHHHHHHHPHPQQTHISSTSSTTGPRSANSSPGPYRRERFPSVSSGSSSTVPERRRPPRPKYDEEEMYFIWYHRIDLGKEWRQVRESFNRQFPNRQRRGFQGIQCKLYRFIKEKDCPTLREQRRRRSAATSTNGANHRYEDDRNPAFGVVRWTGVRYPWMID